MLNDLSDDELAALRHSIGGPARGALEAAGYTDLRQLQDVPDKDLLALHGVGPKAVRLIREAGADR